MSNIDITLFKNPNVIVAICFLASLFLFGIIRLYLKRKQAHDYSVVEQYSLKLIELHKINESFSRLTAVVPKYKHSFYVDSKNAYTNFNYSKHIRDYVQSHRHNFSYIVDSCKLNAAAYEKYLSRISQYVDPLGFPSEAILKQSHIRSEKFAVIESELVEKLKYPPPVIYPIFRFELHYASPKGRNHYSSYMDYSIRDIEMKFREIEDINQKKQTAAYQRQLMTPKLRYQVMKRDGFRCVRCGRTADDGVKLHVDHIIPVSKGGKTVLRNLQTLCQDCNFGKGADYDFLDE